MPTKLDGFSGDKKGQNVQSWVDQLTTIQDITGWPDEIIIKHCAMLLSGTAQQWYLTEGKDYRTNWDRFSRALVKKFTLEINPWLTTRYTENIKQRKDETCRDFMDRVRRELRTLNISSEERVCEVFMSGCLSEIGAGIIRSIGRDPVDAKKLEEIAVRLEMANRMEKKKSSGMMVPQIEDRYVSGNRLQLRKEGRCFRCKEQGHRIQDCPHQPNRNKEGDNVESKRVTGGGERNNNVRMVSEQEKIPLSEWKKTLFCKICKQNGHTQSYCPSNKIKKYDSGHKPKGNQRTQGQGNVRIVSSTTPAHINDEQHRENDSDQDNDGDSDSYLGSIASVRTVEKDGEVGRIHVVDNIKRRQRRSTYTVTGTIWGRPIEIMIDTGATRSCIHVGLIKQLRNKADKCMTQTGERLHLETANGDRLTVLGNVVLPIQFGTNRGTREMNISLIMVPDLTVVCLLGTDFLNQYGAGLGWVPGQERLTLRNGDHIPLITIDQSGIRDKRVQQKERVSLVRLAKDITIPASCMMVTTEGYTLAIHDEGKEKDENNKIGTGNKKATVMAQGDDKLYHDGVMLASSIHDLENTGSSRVQQGRQRERRELVLQLANTTSKDITYRKGTCIGRVYTVEILEQQDISKSMDVKESIIKEIKGKIKTP